MYYIIEADYPFWQVYISKIKPDHGVNSTNTSVVVGNHDGYNTLEEAKADFMLMNKPANTTFEQATRYLE